MTTTNTDTKPLLVTVRMTGGCYLARSKGHTASCTSSAEQAAARCAAKAFDCLDTRIHLQPLGSGSKSSQFLTLPEPHEGFATASALIDAHAKRMGWRS